MGSHTQRNTTQHTHFKAKCETHQNVRNQNERNLLKLCSAARLKARLDINHVRARSDTKNTEKMRALFFLLGVLDTARASARKLLRQSTSESTFSINFPFPLSNLVQENSPQIKAYTERIAHAHHKVHVFKLSMNTPTSSRNLLILGPTAPNPQTN